METREEAISFCKTFKNVIENHPFRDSNWALIRHIENKKAFACIYERENHVWINVKCSPDWRDVWRSAYASVIPAYHMNKEHWNSVILDGTIPEHEVERMIEESYELTKAKRKIKSVNSIN